MQAEEKKRLLSEIAGLKDRLEESEQLINAIKAGEVDAFAINTNNKPDVYTLESGDYAYRVLVEQFGEGALTITEEGLIVYTNNYFCELLGLSYGEVIRSSFFNLLHPRSAEYFQHLLADSLKGKSKGEILLAIGDRSIPVYISMTSLQPKLPSLGIIITDLTRRKEIEAVILTYQKDLELKNNALMQTNTELASFAYIASHDLQEPLRKIQTFADIILEKEAASFSSDTKNYFDRIILASQRMQRLIKDLLDYSRFTVSEKDYLVTDLNKLMKEAKDNLQYSLEESGATIESSELPSLKVIPYQLVQLFSNLIQNAIKYRKPGVAPYITISASKKASAQLNLPPGFPADHYWEIRIRDNGIGFEQQYAAKIFQLFQRLSSHPKIEGTGIGLPICQKIVQNHEGHITAEAEPGLGATFVVYLPALKNNNLSQ
jgi:PAS domain S-box-containing protein